MSGQPELVKLARRAMPNDPESISGDLVRSWDALLAENQRLRDALAGIARWTNPKTDTLEEVIAYAREALAGDAE